MAVNDELYHYGIPGMKWGIRRFRKWQLKRRLKKGREKAKKYQAWKKEALKNPDEIRKHYDEFSPAEIKSALDRFNTIKALNDSARLKREEAASYLDTANRYLMGSSKAISSTFAILSTLDKIDNMKSKKDAG